MHTRKRNVRFQLWILPTNSLFFFFFSFVLYENARKGYIIRPNLLSDITGYYYIIQNNNVSTNDQIASLQVYKTRESDQDMLAIK